MKPKHIACSLLLLTGCMSEPKLWPANVTIKDFSLDETPLIKNAVENINWQSKSKIITFDAPGEKTFTIVIRSHKGWDEFPTRVGLATYTSQYCNVFIAKKVFTNKPTTIPTIVWHEIGHCAGLEHDKIEGEVMYKVTTPYTELNPGALKRFWNLLVKAVQ